MAKNGSKQKAKNNGSKLNMYDVIIIGMGMSGITAGIYAKRAGLNVLMFEKNVPGGMLMQIDKIKNYPGFEEISGSDLAMHLFNQVKKLDIFLLTLSTVTLLQLLIFW